MVHCRYICTGTYVKTVTLPFYSKVKKHLSHINEQNSSLALICSSVSLCIKNYLLIIPYILFLLTDIRTELKLKLSPLAVYKSVLEHSSIIYILQIKFNHPEI